MAGLLKKYFLFLVFSIFISCSNHQTEVSFKHKLVLQSYLDEYVLKPSFGGKVFSAHTVIGTDPEKIYVWAFLQEYYTIDGEMDKGTAWSVPLILKVKNSSQGIKVVGHQYPRDGGKYMEDVQSMFPKNLQQKITQFPKGPVVKELENESNERALLHIKEIKEEK